MVRAEWSDAAAHAFGVTSPARHAARSDLGRRNLQSSRRAPLPVSFSRAQDPTSMALSTRSSTGAAPATAVDAPSGRGRRCWGTRAIGDRRACCRRISGSGRPHRPRAAWPLRRASTGRARHAGRGGRHRAVRRRGAEGPAAPDRLSKRPSRARPGGSPRAPIQVATDRRVRTRTLSGRPLRIVIEPPEALDVGRVPWGSSSLSDRHRAVLDAAQRPRLVGGLEVLAEAFAAATPELRADILMTFRNAECSGGESDGCQRRIVMQWFWRHHP